MNNAQRGLVGRVSFSGSTNVDSGAEMLVDYDD